MNMYLGVCECVYMCLDKNEKEWSIFSNVAKVLREPHYEFPWKHESLPLKKMAGYWRKGRR